MDYIVSGPHLIPRRKVSKGVMPLDLSKEALEGFWGSARTHTGHPIGPACGCYIYAIRAGRGITPWYVGQATGGFDQEVFSLDKYKKYIEHYETVKKGTPIILFVIRQTPKGRIEGVSLDKVEAGWVEDYLIRRALYKNPHLINTHNTKKFTTVKIPGVHNATAKTPADKALATALGMSKPYGFTTPVGKFHKKK